MVSFPVQSFCSFAPQKRILTPNLHLSSIITLISSEEHNLETNFAAKKMTGNYIFIVDKLVSEFYFP